MSTPSCRSDYQRRGEGERVRDSTKKEIREGQLDEGKRQAGGKR